MVFCSRFNRFASLRMLRLYELADLLEKVVPWKSSQIFRWVWFKLTGRKPWDRKMQMKHNWGNIPSRERSHIPPKWHFEDDFPFPKVGYVNSLEGTSETTNQKLGRSSLSIARSLVFSASKFIIGNGVLLVRYPCSSIFQWIIVQKKHISFKRKGSRKIGFLKSC